MADEIPAGSTVSEPDDDSTPADSQASDEPDDMAIDNPGSNPEQYLQDRERKEYLFQIPGFQRVLEPHLDHVYVRPFPSDRR